MDLKSIGVGRAFLPSRVQFVLSLGLISYFRQLEPGSVILTL